MYIIAVTGGIACGKTVVSREISKFGAEIISADAIAYELSEPGQPIYNAYLRHFGRCILDDDEQLNRRAIGGIVFNDMKERKWIDRTTHPLLLNRVRDKLVETQEKGFPIAVLDVPLLFEAGWQYLADEVWVVWLSKMRQFRRLMYRNKLNPFEASARINSQMDVNKKRALADLVINNSRPRAELKAYIEKLMNYKFPHLTRNPSLEDELEMIAAYNLQQKEEREQLEALMAQQAEDWAETKQFKIRQEYDSMTQKSDWDEEKKYKIQQNYLVDDDDDD